MVQLNYDGGVIGSLEKQPVYPLSRFNQAELAEINRAKNISQTLIINQQLVDNIKQNTRLERNIVVFDPESGKYYEADDWFVHNQWRNTNEAECLIFNADAMVRAKDLNEAEKAEVYYISEQQQQQQQQFFNSFTNNNKISISKVFSITGVISALLIASIVIVRKKLNNKR